MRPQAEPGADAAIVVDVDGLREIAWGFSRAAAGRGSARIAAHPGDGEPYSLHLLILPVGAQTALEPRYVGGDPEALDVDGLLAAGVWAAAAARDDEDDGVWPLVARELKLQRLQFTEELDDARDANYWIARLARYTGAAGDADDAQFVRRMTQVAAVAISAARARLRISPAGRVVLGDGTGDPVTEVV